ncbi:MAG: crossover junction endodeoxyribonuclease RuvC [Candidatus Shikimatogenerans sp. AspAUS03]|uniref:Crossover junction endodeoxyribonuclease RuvC n=1 Tax=Candidatus Shikimatogenerans sp. AspAUS03 TaxID=3158563 RepID=A0AAU7QUA1_9FLAO
MKFKKKIIIGIDPGYYNTGLTIIKYFNKKKFKIIKLIQISFKKKYQNNKKIYLLYNYFYKILKTYKPLILIIEKPFYGKNIKILIKLSKLQTIFILLTYKFKILIIKYYPKEIKLTITQNGNSNKNLIYKHLKIIKFYKQKINLSIKTPDINDSLAIALTYIKKTYIK